MNYQDIPVARIDEMVADGLATIYKPGTADANTNYVYFASVVGNHIESYVLKKFPDSGYAVPRVGSSEPYFYQVVMHKVTTDIPANEIGEALHRYQLQSIADREIGLKSN